eukprot:4206170-Pleurochrysis_carterae.AAC.4
MDQQYLAHAAGDRTGPLRLRQGKCMRRGGGSSAQTMSSRKLSSRSDPAKADQISVANQAELHTPRGNDAQIFRRIIASLRRGSFAYTWPTNIESKARLAISCLQCQCFLCMYAT